MDASTASAFYNALTEVLWYFGQVKLGQGSMNETQTMFCTTQLLIGTPPQEFALIVDSGSNVGILVVMLARPFFVVEVANLGGGAGRAVCGVVKLMNKFMIIGLLRRPDPKMGLDKHGNKDPRAQPHEQDMEVGYEDNASQQSFEGLTQKFHDEIIKLTKEQHEAEDVENARHRQKEHAEAREAKGTLGIARKGCM
ncbi:hypothetical protein IFM89_005816 [Coptis chinensis]|uniref:Uncharacterized protein n=1 Tax=Coptis chinensis TaxID=261450 RepID=A0A835LCV0_9MAGN|nr:hypothetical protein IFM89_005816 [Coptis chinensis]